MDSRLIEPEEHMVLRHRLPTMFAHRIAEMLRENPAGLLEALSEPIGNCGLYVGMNDTSEDHLGWIADILMQTADVIRLNQNRGTLDDVSPVLCKVGKVFDEYWESERERARANGDAGVPAGMGAPAGGAE